MSFNCERSTGMGSLDYWQGVSSKVTRQRIPFVGSMALTHRCNLRCVHCYARGDSRESPETELSTGQWIRIVSEVKEAGCLYLLLTGGEPLLRPDFPEIYSHAKKNGFLVTVFTNGTLVSEAAIELFRELPPRLVEISLYGATAGTHDRVTGIPGSFAAARKAIETLIGFGITVGLKTVLLTLNEDELLDMEALARSYGVNFRLDAAVFPSLAGDKAPLELRVPAEKAVALEMANPAREREWREFLEKFHEAPGSESLYICGAGVSMFHIDPCGCLSPCLMVRKTKYPLWRGSFREGWDRGFSDFRGEALTSNAPCRGCRQKLACGYCPGFFEQENGDERIPSEYLCSIGRHRFGKILPISPGG